MNHLINNLITALNGLGGGFCDYAGQMFVQAGVLIVVLLVIDFLIRKRVRATFRYWMWMLVFVKLVLPPTLSLPTGIGYWLGDYFVADSIVAHQPTDAAQRESAGETAPSATAESSVAPETQLGEASYEPVTPAVSDSPIKTATGDSSVAPNLNALAWQGILFGLWIVGVLVITALLVQRIFFVSGLIAQSEPAKDQLVEVLDQCRQQVGLRRRIELRLSHNVTCPAVCGLLHPAILIPKGILEQLSQEKLRAVLIHELAHIKRGDLWINCVQTLLQIAYFYHPFVWLANTVVRKLREQAVDEMVLLALGAEAKSYGNTLIDVAEMAFFKTSLSLRLIGVIESQKALQGRIKHMLARPVPKSAKLGILGLMTVLFFGVLLLPMARAQKQSADNTAGALDSDKDGLENELEAELGTNPKSSDTDGDGLSDYDEYCKYRTDPTKKDSDGDGKPDGDWQERREYAYTIRAICEIRPPSSMEMIDDLYQDARPVEKKATLKDARVVEVLIFPFATAHVYAQPFPKENLDTKLREYIQPTVSMNFSPEMIENIKDIVHGAATDVEAIEKMLHWMDSETTLVREMPHWEYLNIVDGKIVWHKSLGSPERDEQFLETNFLGDSMFKKKVHGTCSSTAILRGTMFRAAGLPTRLVQTLPLITRYSEDPEPLADQLRMREMAEGYAWGPGNGGANHTYNEVFLNNHWVRIDNSIGTGPFVGDKLFVKAWSSASWNNLKEEWNDKRCFRAIHVSDAYPKYKSESTKVDMAIEDKDLTVTRQPDGRFLALIRIYNKGSQPTPQFGVNFYAGDPDKGGRLLAQHRAGPIMPGGNWGEYNPRLELRSGEAAISVVIDPDNRVDESDETNNKASQTISPALQKDDSKAPGEPSSLGSKPNIFIMSPSDFGMFREIFNRVKDVTWNKTGRYHEKKSYDEIFIDEIHNKKPGDIIVLLFSLDSPDRIPAEYEDLLPKPWPEIEAALKQGKTVELKGEARELNVILLAAPTSTQLRSLVQESKLLNALAKPPQSGIWTSGFAATLPNGVAVELVAVCEHPSEGKQWWRPDGTILSQAPYHTTGSQSTDERQGYVYYEFALKLSDPDRMSYFWMIPGSGHGSDTGSPREESGHQIPALKAYATNLPKEQKNTTVRIGATAAQWQTIVTYKPDDREETYSVGEYAIAFGTPYLKGNQTLLPIVHNYNRKERRYAIQVIAVTKSGQVRTSGYSGSGGNDLSSLTYIFNDLPLETVKEFRFQTRPYTWVEFRNVSLQPGIKTEVHVEIEGEMVVPQKVFDLPPNIFIMEPSQSAFSIFDKVVSLSQDWAWNKTGRQHSKKSYDEIFDGTHNRTANDVLVMVFSLDREDRIPAEYEDLLPRPWGEIEADLKQGRPVELLGKAREMNVILVAAPNMEQLEKAITASKFLNDPKSFLKTG
jgi:beta-lactamase regulating signal transducer with metallopeptidase domain